MRTCETEQLNDLRFVDFDVYIFNQKLHSSDHWYLKETSLY